MKKNIFPLALFSAILFMGSCVKDRVKAPVVVPPVNTSSDTLIHYWNFNTDVATALDPTISIVAGAGLVYAGTGTYDTVQLGTTINARGVDSTDTVGTAALRLRNPTTIGVAPGAFTMSLPTTGYKNIVLKYAEECSSSGAALNTVSYTVDGTNYINTAIASVNYSYPVTTSYQLFTFDFSSDPAVNDNPNFKVQIAFANNPGIATGKGNDRFDNITLYGVKK